jgi:hypothetical protein
MSGIYHYACCCGGGGGNGGGNGGGDPGDDNKIPLSEIQEFSVNFAYQRFAGTVDSWDNTNYYPDHVESGLGVGDDYTAVGYGLVKSYCDVPSGAARNPAPGVALYIDLKDSRYVGKTLNFHISFSGYLGETAAQCMFSGMSCNDQYPNREYILAYLNGESFWSHNCYCYKTGVCPDGSESFSMNHIIPVVHPALPNGIRINCGRFEHSYYRGGALANGESFATWSVWVSVEE